MRLKPTSLKVIASLIFGTLLGAFFGLREICIGNCPTDVEELWGFQYSLNNNNILSALIFAIPFVLFIYLGYSLLQKEPIKSLKSRIVKSKTLSFKEKKTKHVFGWKDLRKEMIWETVLEGIILVGVIGLVILYFVLYILGNHPKPEMSWMFWAIISILAIVLVAAIFYVIVFIRYLKLTKKSKSSSL
jgi:hypothetical protein